MKDNDLEEFDEIGPDPEENDEEFIDEPRKGNKPQIPSNIIRRVPNKKPVEQDTWDEDESEKDKRSVQKSQSKKETPQQSKEQQQYVAVPRAVTVETMLNEIYDGQQEIKQMISILIDKSK